MKHERQLLLDFLAAHADGDVLIQAANRVSNNLEDINTLRTFIRNYKGPVTHAEDYLGGKPRVVETGDNGPLEVDGKSDGQGEPEDLGLAPKKLGSNGQTIFKLMQKKSDHEFSIDGLHAETKIAKAKIKPMLALLLERKQIKRATNFTYQVNG
jgi:hypothetical protein